MKARDRTATQMLLKIFPNFCLRIAKNIIHLLIKELKRNNLSVTGDTWACKVA